MRLQDVSSREIKFLGSNQLISMFRPTVGVLIFSSIVLNLFWNSTFLKRSPAPRSYHMMHYMPGVSFSWCKERVGAVWGSLSYDAMGRGVRSFLAWSFLGGSPFWSVFVHKSILTDIHMPWKVETLVKWTLMRTQWSHKLSFFFYLTDII